jgi:hypothetical protein
MSHIHLLTKYVPRWAVYKDNWNSTLSFESSQKVEKTGVNYSYNG